MKAIHSTGLLRTLQKAREKVAHGCPSLVLAMAGTPYGTARARVEQAEAARFDPSAATPFLESLTEALALVDEARELWGKEPAHVPPAASTLPPCGMDLRPFLVDAIRCSDMGLAWEDTSGLSRPQALCVVHLAICLALWRLREAQAELTAHQERERLNREGDARAAVAARAIWGGQPKKPAEEPKKVPASLRELASVSRAFADWGPVDEDDAHRLAMGGEP